MISIYEVMAIEGGKPLFFAEHIDRFSRSISDFREISRDELNSLVKDLIEPHLKGSEGMNLKVTYSVDNDDFTVISRPQRVPDPQLYKTGAAVGLFHGERDTPLIKKETPSLREETERICREKNLYELLLVNKHCEITEGSRTNFLLIENNKIISSPIGDALNGVTRTVIFKICKENNIEIIEKKIKRDDLISADSMIITGTSPGILPVKQCEDISFNPENSITELLQYEYNKRKQE